MEKKCSCCGSAKMKAGTVQTADSFKLFFIADQESKKLLPKSDRICAYVCSDCGNVSLFLDNL